MASNSETGGVGCDNMTMAVIGILNGQTKDEWYAKIAERVANGDGPCAPPEYGTSPSHYYVSLSQAKSLFAAEFRGPGVHHNFDDSDSGYDMDMAQGGGSRNIISGGRKGRIILLGDGSEILTGPEDDSDLIDGDAQMAEADAADAAAAAKAKQAEEKVLKNDDSVPEKLTGSLKEAKEKIEDKVHQKAEEKKSE